MREQEHVYGFMMMVVQIHCQNQPFLIVFKKKKKLFNVISMIHPKCFTVKCFLSSIGQLGGYLEDKMEQHVLCRHLMEFTF